MPDLAKTKVRRSVFVPTEAWEVMQLTATWVLCATAIATGFWGRSTDSLAAVLLYSTICGVMLILARLLRVLLADILGQFHYREKFALFLVHLGVMLVPWFVGFRGWNHALAAVLCLMCLQAINRLMFGRIYAVSLLLLLMHLVDFDVPPFPIVAAWMLAFLAAIRCEAIRFALESHGQSHGLGLRDAVRESIVPVGVTWLAGVGVFFAAQTSFGEERRALNLTPGTMRGAGELGPVTFGSFAFDAILLAGLIIATLVTLHWLDSKLRRTKKGLSEEEELLGGREERQQRESAVVEEPRYDEDAGPRGRVLRRFRLFARATMRRDGETPREFLDRLADGLGGGDSVPPSVVPVINRAAYSKLPLSDDEAGELIRRLDAMEEELEKPPPGT